LPRLHLAHQLQLKALLVPKKHLLTNVPAAFLFRQAKEAVRTIFQERFEDD
jgi:hypothetical protein